LGLSRFYTFWQKKVEAAAKEKVEEVSKALEEKAAHNQELQKKLEASEVTAKKIQDNPPPPSLPLGLSGTTSGAFYVY